MQSKFPLLISNPKGRSNQVESIGSYVKTEKILTGEHHYIICRCPLRIATLNPSPPPHGSLVLRTDFSREKVKQAKTYLHKQYVIIYFKKHFRLGSKTQVMSNLTQKNLSFQAKSLSRVLGLKRNNFFSCNHLI